MKSRVFSKNLQNRMIQPLNGCGTGAVPSSIAAEQQRLQHAQQKMQLQHNYGNQSSLFQCANPMPQSQLATMTSGGFPQHNMHGAFYINQMQACPGKDTIISGGIVHGNPTSLSISDTVNTSNVGVLNGMVNNADSMLKPHIHQGQHSLRHDGSQPTQTQQVQTQSHINMQNFQGALPLHSQPANQQLELTNIVPTNVLGIDAGNVIFNKLGQIPQMQCNQPQQLQQFSQLEAPLVTPSSSADAKRQMLIQQQHVIQQLELQLQKHNQLQRIDVQNNTNHSGLPPSNKSTAALLPNSFPSLQDMRQNGQTNSPIELQPHLPQMQRDSFQMNMYQPNVTTGLPLQIQQTIQDQSLNSGKERNISTNDTQNQEQISQQLHTQNHQSSSGNDGAETEQDLRKNKIPKVPHRQMHTTTETETKKNYFVARSGIDRKTEMVETFEASASDTMRGLDGNEKHMRGNIHTRQKNEPLNIRQAATSWHSNSDKSDRERIFTCILNALQATKSRGKNNSEKLPLVARRLEERLYRMSQTKEDYVNVNTLKKRLQILIFGMGGSKNEKQQPRAPLNNDENGMASIGGIKNKMQQPKRPLNNDAKSIVSMGGCENEMQQPKPPLNNDGNGVFSMRGCENEKQSVSPLYNDGNSFYRMEVSQNKKEEPKAPLNNDAKQQPIASVVNKRNDIFSMIGSENEKQEPKVPVDNDGNESCVSLEAQQKIQQLKLIHQNMNASINLKQEQSPAPLMQNREPVAEITSSGVPLLGKNTNRVVLQRKSKIGSKIRRPQARNSSKEGERLRNVRKQQHRLLLLRHASKCTISPSCPTMFCSQMKLLWNHMKKCSDLQCHTPHCFSSRFVLNHYRICSKNNLTDTCEVCAPLKRGRGNYRIGRILEPGLREQRASVQTSGQKSREDFEPINTFNDDFDMTLATEQNSEVTETVGNDGKDIIDVKSQVADQKQRQQKLLIQDIQQQQMQVAKKQESLKQQNKVVLRQSLEGQHLHSQISLSDRCQHELQQQLVQLQEQCKKIEHTEDVNMSDANEHNSKQLLISGNENQKMRHISEIPNGRSELYHKSGSLHQGKEVGKRIRRAETGLCLSVVDPSNEGQQVKDKFRSEFNWKESSLKCQNSNMAPPLNNILPQVNDTIARDNIKNPTPPLNVESFEVSQDNGIISANQCNLPDVATKCLPLVRRLLDDPCGWVFADPVDPEDLGLPDYFDIIKKPMDLSLVKKRLEGGFYHNLGEFKAEVLLVFQNAVMYNGEDSEVGRIAGKFMASFKGDFGLLLNEATV